MSQENVEIARSYLEGTEEGMRGAEVIEALVNDFWEPDGDYYPVRGFPEVRPCHGRAEIVRFLTAVYPAWDEYRYVIKDARAVGDDRVLVHGAIRAEGRSGPGRPHSPLSCTTPLRTAQKVVEAGEH
jgi:SnoaL-like domain